MKLLSTLFCQFLLVVVIIISFYWLLLYKFLLVVIIMISFYWLLHYIDSCWLLQRVSVSSQDCVFYSLSFCRSSVFSATALIVIVKNSNGCGCFVRQTSTGMILYLAFAYSYKSMNNSKNVRSNFYSEIFIVLFLQCYFYSAISNRPESMPLHSVHIETNKVSTTVQLSNSNFINNKVIELIILK